MNLFEEKNQAQIKHNRYQILTNVQIIVQFALLINSWDSLNVKLFKALEINLTTKLVVISEFYVTRVIRLFLEAERGHKRDCHHLYKNS
jgi:hypothetical protein